MGLNKFKITTLEEIKKTILKTKEKEEAFYELSAWSNNRKFDANINILEQIPFIAKMKKDNSIFNATSLDFLFIDGDPSDGFSWRIDVYINTKEKIGPLNDKNIFLSISKYDINRKMLQIKFDDILFCTSYGDYDSLYIFEDKNKYFELKKIILNMVKKLN